MWRQSRHLYSSTSSKLKWSNYETKCLRQPRFDSNRETLRVRGTWSPGNRFWRSMKPRTSLNKHNCCVIIVQRAVKMIYSKVITTAPPRLRRMLISLNGYSVKGRCGAWLENQLRSTSWWRQQTAQLIQNNHNDVNMRTDMVYTSTDINIITEQTQS